MHKDRNPPHILKLRTHGDSSKGYARDIKITTLLSLKSNVCTGIGCRVIHVV